MAAERAYFLGRRNVMSRQYFTYHGDVPFHEAIRIVVMVNEKRRKTEPCRARLQELPLGVMEDKPRRLLLLPNFSENVFTCLCTTLHDFSSPPSLSQRNYCRNILIIAAGETYRPTTSTMVICFCSKFLVQPKAL